MSAQLQIASMTDEQRQSAVARLSEQPLNVLQAAREIIVNRTMPNEAAEIEDRWRLALLNEAIIYKAFENLLDPDCAEEQEKYRKVIRIGGEQ